MATGVCTARCFASEFRAGAPGAGNVLSLSPEPAASRGLVVWPVELRPVLGRACRAVARSGSGSETDGLNGPGSCGKALLLSFKALDAAVQPRG